MPKDVIGEVNSEVELKSAALAYLAEHPIELVFRVTPKEYNLIEQQVITLLKGENNIWSTANGDIEITYKAKKSNS